jgi:hypothetical protein
MSLSPTAICYQQPRAASARWQRGKFPIGAGSPRIDFRLGCATVLYGDKDAKTPPEKTQSCDG